MLENSHNEVKGELKRQFRPGIYDYYHRGKCTTRSDPSERQSATVDDPAPEYNLHEEPRILV